MSRLKLVVNHTQEFCGLIEAFEGLLGHEADGHFEISRSAYAGLLAIYLENLDNGMSIRIICDPARVHAGRQGIHTRLDIDEYELAEMLDQATSQGFDTIWVHS